MAWFKPHGILDDLFEASVIIKGVGASLEFLGGALLLFIGTQQIQSFVHFVTQEELLGSPHGSAAAYLLHASQHFSNGGRWFAISYLWSHALIKLVAVIGLLRNKLWAYPFSLLTLTGFMIYQTYHIVEKATVGMIALTIFDVVVFWLIWREYQKVRTTQHAT